MFHDSHTNMCEVTIEYTEADDIISKEEQTLLGTQFIDLKERRLLSALETKPVRELEKATKS